MLMWGKPPSAVRRAKLGSRSPGIETNSRTIEPGRAGVHSCHEPKRLSAWGTLCRRLSRLLCRSRRDPQLLQHSERVPIRPTFDKLSVFYPTQTDPGDGHPPPSSWNVSQISPVRAGDRPSRYNHLSLSELVFDGKVTIGKRVEVMPYELFVSFDAAHSQRGLRIMLCEICCDHLIHSIQLLLVPHIFQNSARQFLVIGSH